jgi:peptidyl-dipeptidase A
MLSLLTVVLAAAKVSAAPAAAAAAPAPAQPTAAEAKAFADKVNADLRKIWVRSSQADWIKSTFITDDTEQNAAAMHEDELAYLNTTIKESLRFKNVKADADTERALHLLRVAQTAPAPSDPGKRGDLAHILAKMEGDYGKGKWCGKDYEPGKDEKEDKKRCKDLQQLSDVLTKGSYDQQLEAWNGWHTISRDMRKDYARMVDLANEGAQEIGFSNLGELWRSGYDMSPADFEKETDRLWNQVKPLYDDLHCYVRAQLVKKYGADKVDPKGPIPAHLLGNMWAQEWGNVYPLVEPYKGQGSLDVTAALQRQRFDEVKLVRLGESFFTSLGMDPLPKSFWERSQLKKPQDREVVCHASSWDVTYSDDLRLKMCIKIDEEDLETVHHELGHSYYFMQYYKLPILFQQGANDGFHEAIGDALTLSITPEYLKKLGLINALPKDEKGLINLQMKDAMDKVAFLPFGRMIDQWRWDVFSGKTPPNEYNRHWWELREKYQGVKAPNLRSELDFDPGAKYHIAANVPYMRYFLARILQFQFHRAMCKAAGHTGPLYTCSIYGNREAGAKLKAMLALGASKPWQEALFTMTGEKQMDATAVLEYFEPLAKWLKEQNRNLSCGW